MNDKINIYYVCKKNMLYLFKIETSSILNKYNKFNKNYSFS